MPVLINGGDLAATVAALGAGYAFTDATWSGDLDPAADAPATRPALGLYGESLTGAPATLAPRTLRVEGYLQAPSAAGLEAARDALVQTCLGGTAFTQPSSSPVRVTLVPSASVGGGSGRMYFGYLTAESRVTRVEPVGLATWAKVALVFRCPDPRGYAESLTTVSLAHAVKARPLALGTAPSDPVFTLPGPWSSVILFFEDSGDNVLASLTVFARTPLLTGESVEIDMGQQMLTKIDGSGNRSPVNSWYEAGTFFPIDPGAKNGTPTPCVLPLADGAPGGWSGTMTYRLAYR